MGRAWAIALRGRMRGERRLVRAFGCWLLLTICYGLILAVPAPAIAVEADEVLAEPGLEARARAISAGLRCLVCQNQSIDDSNAPLARDLRLIVRERLQKGDSDAQVVDYVAARYGEFVLLRPRFEAKTLALWLAAPIVLALGLWALALSRRRMLARAAGASRPLSAEEERRLSEILERDGPGAT